MDVAHAAAAVEQHTLGIGHDVGLSNTTLEVTEEKFRNEGATKTSCFGNSLLLRLLVPRWESSLPEHTP